MSNLPISAAREIAQAGIDYAWSLGIRKGVSKVPRIKMISGGSAYNRLTGTLYISRDAFADRATLIQHVGHELGHRIADKHVGWPGMLSIGQSGAVSEGLGEVFGGLLRQHLATTDAARAAALRGISAAGEFEKIGGKLVPRPRHMRDYRFMFHDMGGIHFNAGIVRESAYILNAREGHAAAADLFAYTLRNLRRTTRFAGFVQAQEGAARNLVHRRPSLMGATVDALRAVGLRS